MQQSRRDLWVPLAGVLAAVSFVVGVLMAMSGPDSNDSDRQVLAWYADHGHRVTNLVGAYLLAVCGLALVWFVAGLRRRLREADSAGRLPDVVFAAGVLLVGMLWIGTAAAVSISGDMSFGGVAGPKTADIARFLPQVGMGAILVFGMFAAIAMIVSTSLVALRSRALPRWFGWLGLLCSVVLLFAVVFVPMLALPVWLLAASGVCLRRPAAEPQTAPRVAHAQPTT